MLGQPHLTDQGDEVVLYFWGINTNHNGVLDPHAAGPGDGGDGVRTAITSVRMRLDGFCHVTPTRAATAAVPAALLTRVLTFTGNAWGSGLRTYGACQFRARYRHSL